MSGSRVYIGHLPHRATERDIERFFRGYGRLRDVVMKNGFGFVEFDDVRDAEDAVHDLNGRDLCGERVVVELSRRGPRGGGGYGGDRGGRGGPPQYNSRYGPPVQTRYRLVVENLSTRCSWQDLKDLMRNAGEVTYADAHRKTRNEALVCFATHEDLKRAIDKYQGKDINGRNIKLIDDTEGADRRRR
ncbi:Sfrs5 protein [Aphelenchoides avenae]|nr:Sfrs5 protein [Aphelenchus avenae]